MNVSELKKIINEEINNEIERNPTMSKSAFPQTERDSEKVYKDAASKRVEPDTSKAHTPLIARDTPSKSYTGFDRDLNKGQERIKYDNIDDKFQKRVNALVMGKNSPLEEDIDDEEQGVSTKSNEKFNEKAKAMNAHDNNNSGIGSKNTALVQFGSDIEPLPGEKPAHQNSAFESKIKRGDVFVEINKGLTLKVSGISEDNKSVLFLDENTNKQYSLLKENFKKAISNNVLINENEEERWLYNYWRGAVQNLDLVQSKKWSDAYYKKFGEHPVNTSAFQADRKTQEALEQMKLMGECGDMLASQQNEQKRDNVSEPFKDVIQEPVTGQVRIASPVKTVNQGATSNPTADIKEQKSRLIFKKTRFFCESHMISLIPEHYKVDGKQFKMLDNDGNEYLIEWNEKAQILEHKNEKSVQDQMQRMKKLWEHKPENTDRSKQVNTCILGEVKKKRLNEEGSGYGSSQLQPGDQGYQTVDQVNFKSLDSAIQQYVQYNGGGDTREFVWNKAKQALQGYPDDQVNQFITRKVQEAGGQW